jgi:hypothetical protein
VNHAATPGPAPALTDPVVLLAAWEAAAALPPPVRPLALVHPPVAGPDPAASLQSALDLPLGEVARLAARTYVETFGDRVESTLRCATCAAELELELSLAALAADVQDRGDTGWLPVGGGTAELIARPPTVRDLLAVRSLGDATAGLIERCVRGADGRATAVGELTTDQLAAVDADLEERSGPAGAVLRTGCPDCGAVLVSAVDVGALLWEQVAAAVPVLLSEVVALASAFGWSEDAVLGLSAARRRAYLALVDAS